MPVSPDPWPVVTALGTDILAQGRGALLGHIVGFLSHPHFCVALHFERKPMCMFSFHTNVGKPSIVCIHCLLCSQLSCARVVLIDRADGERPPFLDEERRIRRVPDHVFGTGHWH